MLQVNFEPFPVLTTDRLVLRQITAADANEIFEMRSDENVMKYICRPRPKDVDEVFPFIETIRGRIAANEGIGWAITLKDEDKVIGHISLHVIIKEHYRAEVGYMLSPAHQRKGITAEALKAVLDYGFNTLGLHSIMAIASPHNTASRTLLEKTGFTQEAHFKEDFFWKGKFLDSVVYSLLTPVK
jgi:ribosomal-protein-alanine N-acetyltransferase